MGEPTVKARQECLEWLHYCLKIGWPKSAMDDLEVIWWKYHDGSGRLKI